MKVEIKNRYDGSTILVGEYRSKKEAIEKNLTVDFSNAYLQGVDLRKAILRGADFNGANLMEVDLSEADLRDADLRDADLRGVDLRGANLRGADFCDDLRGVDFRNVNYGSFNPVRQKNSCWKGKKTK